MASVKKEFFDRYVARAMAGDPPLPPYETDDNGHIVMHIGEVFCRVPDCSSQTKQFSHTGNLRVHIKAHKDLTLPGRAKGAPSVEDKNASIAWYKSLFAPPKKMAVPFTKAGNIGIKEIKDFLRTKHVTQFPCESCEQANAKCCATPFVCEYLDRYYDVEDSFDRPE
ncbi:hypothetical protein N7508_001305 [Penicillium antarcticum]|uniref:uncharacterized protein n=1 Tax=Penicillium antarcticum TaxID=416450 RepID=UPI00238D9FFC|nr:uncharacterized protein N7508_001305 [Penicillium antarcticum]KAJ5316797.1 hypothetical protein N7508_001305 [Penicillium antarcticum]